MGSNTWRSEEWPSIIDRILAGDPSVAQILAARERVHDNFFQLLKLDDFSPTALQGATALTYTANASVIQGIRVGPWVQLNVKLRITNSPGAAGAISISVPPQFPIQGSVSSGSSLYPVVGTFWFGRSGGLGYTGAAISASDNTVSGYSDAVGVIGTTPANSVAAGDDIGYSIQYQTSAAL